MNDLWRKLRLRPMDIAVLIVTAWYLWRSLHLAGDGEYLGALYWLAFIILILWLTDPLRRKRG